MEAVAKTSGVRISPRKVQLVADAVRGMSVAQAMQVLTLAEKRGASILLDTLKSAVANAVNNGRADEKNLVIKSLIVSKGQFLKRFHMAARGRTRPYTKRSTHVTIVVAEKEASKGGNK